MSKNAVPFRLSKINTEEFAAFPENLHADAAIDFNVGVLFGVNPEDNAIKCAVRASHLIDDKPILLIQGSCEFEIEPQTMKGMIKGKKRVFTIEKNLAIHFALLTTGTVRGILHAKTENTPFNQFVLPTVNVNELVEENVVIELV